MQKNDVRKSRGILRYAQIATYMRANLESGLWPVGSRLPSIESLARKFGVAPLTMRQSLALLEEDGLVERRQGYGTVVTASPRQLRWLALPTDWDTLLSVSGRLEVSRLLIERGEQMPQNVLGEPDFHEKYHLLKRIHSQGGEPFCEVNIHIASWVFEKSPERFRDSIALLLIDEMPEVRIGKARQNIRVDVADAETAQFLEIPLGAAVARVRRTICDTDGRVIYHGDLIYRGDIIYLDMDISPA